MSVKFKKLSKKLLTMTLMMSLILTGVLMLRSESCMASTIDEPPLKVSPVQFKNADGTITVLIQAVGTVSSFDVGLVYDKTKLKVVAIDYDSGFESEYDDGQGILVCRDLGTHVVFGGVHAVDDYNYFGRLATVRFSVIGSDPGTVMTVLNSASYKGDFSNAANDPTTTVLKLRK